MKFKFEFDIVLEDILKYNEELVAVARTLENPALKKQYEELVTTFLKVLYEKNTSDEPETQVM